MTMNRNIVLGAVVLLLVAGGIWFANAQKSDVMNNEEETTNQMPVTSGENPEPGSEVHDLPAEPAAEAARADLAADLGVDEKSIVILSVTEMTWTDGCLGLGGPAESCLQALVDGFRVELLAEGETYVYRTDKTGASVRAES